MSAHRFALFVGTLALIGLAQSVHAQGILTPQGGFRINMDGNPAPARLGSVDKDLTMTPVYPCRIVDTRVAGGAIAANTSRSFLAVAVSAGITFAFQGGSATDCGVAAVNASAVALNVTAVAPAGAGFATIYQSGTARPLAASLNYSAGSVVNNTVIVSIPNPLAITDFVVYTFAQSHFVIDIVGYYSLPEATPAQCVSTSVTTTSVAAGATTFTLAPVCPAGYQATTPYCWGNLVSNTGSGFDGNNPANRLFCGWYNSTGSAQNVSTGAVCCRVPGK